MGKKISDERKLAAEVQLEELRKEIDFDTRDYSVDFLVAQFQENEFYIPDEYQRKYIWEESNKAKFIESILLGLPIPFMFFCDSDDGRCEIIDGAQRTQTLVEFYENDLQLAKLKKLTSLNGFKYNDLPELYRRKFNKTTLRVIVLSEETTIPIRQEIFNRINTSGVRARSIEIRRGSYAGPFMDFLKKCAEFPEFISVCPVSENAKKRYEDLELVLRFFAFINNYKSFTHRVDEFLDNYVESVKTEFDYHEAEVEFKRMLRFVNDNFEWGFRKFKGAKSTPRVRFEAISVGAGLALRDNPNLVPKSMDWLESDDFKRHTTTHASNSPLRVTGRIEYVRDVLLKGGVCN